jgi:formylmethanofuran dehydrogenase subunit E
MNDDLETGWITVLFSSNCPHCNEENDHHDINPDGGEVICDHCNEKYIARE